MTEPVALPLFSSPVGSETSVVGQLDDDHRVARDRQQQLDSLRRMTRQLSADEIAGPAVEATPLPPLLADLGIAAEPSLVVELVPEAGHPLAEQTTLQVAAALCRAGRRQGDRQSADALEQPIVWVDPTGTVYPPAVESLHRSSRIVWVRPQQARDTLWACEQIARCRSVRMLVVAVDAIDPTAMRRLKLAAEAGGTLVVLRRPAAAAGGSCWADVRLQAGVRETGRDPAAELTYRPRLTLRVLSQRGQIGGRSFGLDWPDPLTGRTTLSSQVTPPIAASSSLSSASSSASSASSSTRPPTEPPMQSLSGSRIDDAVPVVSELADPASASETPQPDRRRWQPRRRLRVVGSRSA